MQISTDTNIRMEDGLVEGKASGRSVKKSATQVLSRNLFESRSYKASNAMIRWFSHCWFHWQRSHNFLLT